MVTLGPRLYTAIAAVDELRPQYGISAEAIDLRSANPLNYAPLVESVCKTGKVLLACDAVDRGSVMQSVAGTLWTVRRWWWTRAIGSRPRRNWSRCSSRSKLAGGRDSRESQAACRLPAEDQSVVGRDGAAGEGGDLASTSSRLTVRELRCAEFRHCHP